MPIYEYQCSSCQHTFEQMRRITDETTPDCPTCQSGDVHKLISLSAFHLKGSGWYVTDYGGKKNGVAATDDGSNGNGNGEAAAEGKATDSTPAQSATAPAAKSESGTQEGPKASTGAPAKEMATKSTTPPSTT
jgi:putative FmdB family regulatory protein